MKLVLAALAALLLPHHATAQTIGVDCCNDEGSMAGRTLEEFQAATCYGHTCAAGYNSRWSEGSCDCHQHNGDRNGTNGCCSRQCSDIVGLVCPTGQTLKANSPCYGVDGDCTQDCCGVTCAR